MDNNLNELGVIWQKHQPSVNKEIEMKTLDDTVFSKLNKLEKKHFKINLIKTALVFFNLILLILTILNLNEISTTTKVGLSWIVISLIIFMLYYWKMQFKKSDLNFLEQSTQFIHQTILKLKQQKKVISHLIPILVFNLIIGINMIYVDMLAELSFTNRFFIHIMVSSFMVVILILGLKLRKRRFKNDFQPMIEELEQIHQSFKNNL